MRRSLSKAMRTCEETVDCVVSGEVGTRGDRE